jgi:hypothetical protein
MRPDALSLASASSIFVNAASTFGTSGPSISAESVLKFTSSCGMLTYHGASSTPTQFPCASYARSSIFPTAASLDGFQVTISGVPPARPEKSCSSSASTAFDSS